MEEIIRNVVLRSCVVCGSSNVSSILLIPWHSYGVVIITENYRKVTDSQYTNLAFQHVIHALAFLFALSLTLYPAPSRNVAFHRIR